MKIRRTLLKFYWLRTLSVTVAACPAGLLYVLFAGEWLRWRTPWPWLFILVHSALLAWRLALPPRGEQSFLYSRGNPRDVLWGHSLAAALLAVMVVWLPASLVIWTGLRHALQNAVGNPYYPVFAPLEMPVPWLWLGGYAGLICLLQYAWIRGAQASRGQMAGIFLIPWLVICVVIVASGPLPYRWGLPAALFTGAGVALALLWASRWMHRDMETGE